MKAKVFVDYATPGGLTSIALSQVRKLLEITDEVEVIGPKPLSIELPKGARFRPTYVPETIRDLPGSVRSIASIRQATKDLGGSDFLISHGLRSSLLALLSGKAGKHISVYHGPASASRLRGRIIDFVAEESDLALCVAPQTSPAWKLAYSLSPNCVGTSMEKPRRVAGDLRIGWFTRLDAPKRPDIWFDIVENLALKGSVDGIVFGDGPLLNEMQVLANHCRSQVTFAGVSEPRSGFASMDISLSWSDSEGMPLAIQEAIWFGVPVVTNRLPGIEAYLGDDMVGIVDLPTEAVELITRMRDAQFYKEVIDRQQSRLKEVARQPSMTDQIMEFVRGT